MLCKSCSNPITDNDKFCPNCGGKTVNGRLSIKGTWNEFIGPFFNWENNFWRTFFSLFKNPKDVLEAYISGARKKYFQPFTYLILYTTIAVIFYKIFPLEISVDFSDFVADGNKINANGSTLSFDINGFVKIMYSYYNFFMLALLPFYAIITYLVFIKREHNFSEHLVFNTYIQANLGYISLLLQLILCNLIGLDFAYYTYCIMLFFFIYNMCIFKSLYSLNTKQTLINSLKYLSLGFLVYIVGSLILGVIVVAYMLFFK
ncbi:MAG: DUF3667 domain-containing protein [Aestuariibaculum sp.]